MNHIARQFIFLGLLFILFSCKDKSDITTFYLVGENSTAQIDQVDKEIYYKVSSDIKSGKEVLPKFKISSGAKIYIDGEEQIDGRSTVDFTQPVVYTVISKNKKDTTEWLVTITNNDYTERWGLGMFLSKSHSSESLRAGSWYKSQGNTGEYSDSNCGPACATMAAYWSDSTFAKTVEDARETSVNIKSWFPSNIYNYLKMNNIPVENWHLKYPKEVNGEAEFFKDAGRLIDNNRLLVICLNMRYIKQCYGWEKRVGKHYNGNGGHFLVVKGYRVVDDKLYFEINDPAGSGDMYKDGTLKSQNRYFPASEIYQAITSHNRDIIIVSQKKNLVTILFYKKFI